MSQIINALRKVQAHRYSDEGQSSIIQRSRQSIESEPANNTNKVIGILITLAIVEGIIVLIICIISIVNFNFNRNEVENLVTTIKSQQKEVYNLTVLLNKNKINYDVQIHNMETRLNQVSKESKSKINSLTVAYNDRYVRLKEEILDDRHKMNALIQETKDLKNKVQELSVLNNQKDAITVAME